MGLHDRIADELVGLFVDITRFEAGVQEKVAGLLRDLERDLVHRIREFGDDGRRGRLLSQARASIFSAYDRNNALVARELRDLSTFVGDGTVHAVNTAAGDGARLFISTGFTRADLLAIADDGPIMGGQLKEWMRGQRDATVRGFVSQMRMGYMQGETVPQLIERVRGRRTKTGEFVRDSKGRRREVTRYVGGVMNGTSRKQAESLVRTAVQTVSNNALQKTYEANQDVMSGVITIATLDRRTTELCISRDKASWNVVTGEPLPGSPRGEPFPGYPPWHWRCRSVLGPLTKSWSDLAKEAGGKVPRKFKERVPSDGVRASMGGPVPAAKSYHEWLKGRPVDFQKDILGPSRWKLWKDGKITAHQLTDARGRALSIDELRQRRNLVKPVPKS